jgi:hypothetical protein
MLGPGFPDLNRLYTELYTEAIWDTGRCAWVTPT